MRVILFSTTDIGLDCVRIILEKGCCLAGIVSAPKEFSISYSRDRVTNVRHVDFKTLCQEQGVPLILLEDKMVSLRDVVAALKPDLILVAGWFHMVPKSIRELAPQGCIGFHASLLPKYRGGAPLVWAMINQEKEAGMSLFYLEDGVDSGDIIGQEDFSIEAQDTIADVVKKANSCAGQLLEKYLPLLAQEKAPRVKQDEKQATIYPQRSPEDGRIDWSWSADKINAFIRAQTKPYPGAFTEIEGYRMRLWDACVEEK
ncbi:MAG: methionyl-tRNA formyltransferase [bacterium]